MGLGDFLGGVAEGVGGAVSDIGSGIADTATGVVDAGKNVAKAGAWAVSHADDAVAAVGKYGADAVTGTVKGVGFLATHPEYWDDAAKQMIVDQFTDPVNIATNVAMLGLTVATGGAAAPAWMAKLGLGAKVVGEIGEGAKVLDTVSDVARAGTSIEKVATRAERFAAASARFGEKVESVVNKPTELARGIHSRLAEVVPGMRSGELGHVAAGRLNLAERFVGRAEGGIEEAGAIRRYIGGKIEGGASKSSFVKPGSLAEGHYRASRALGQARSAIDLRGNIQAAGDITQAIAHPERAATELGQAAWHAYGDEAIQFGAKHAPGIIKKAFGGGGDEEPQEQEVRPAPTTYTPEPTQAIGLQQFRLDNTRSTRTSRRSPRGTQIGTITKDSTMPSAIGPSDWYGPQGGYDAGRGFQQRTARPSAPLPGLTQPNQMVGI